MKRRFRKYWYKRKTLLLYSKVWQHRRWKRKKLLHRKRQGENLWTSLQCRPSLDRSMNLLISPYCLGSGTGVCYFRASYYAMPLRRPLLHIRALSVGISDLMRQRRWRLPPCVKELRQCASSWITFSGGQTAQSIMNSVLQTAKFRISDLSSMHFESIQQTLFAEHPNEFPGDVMQSGWLPLKTALICPSTGEVVPAWLSPICNRRKQQSIYAGTEKGLSSGRRKSGRQLRRWFGIIWRCTQWSSRAIKAVWHCWRLQINIPMVQLKVPVNVLWSATANQVWRWFGRIYESSCT